MQSRFLTGGNVRLKSSAFQCLYDRLSGNRVGDGTRAHGKENPPIFYAVRTLFPTRASSQRQLPTDHDCAVSTRGYQSDQPSQKLLDRLLALSSTGNAYREQGKEMQTRLSLLTTGFQNGPRGKGYASPRQKRARP